MKRLLGHGLGLVLLVLAVFVPALLWGGDGDGDVETDSTTITHYDADFTVEEDGDLVVVETLTVDFPRDGKHGIFRFFDRFDRNATDARRTPEDLTVTMDGDDVEWERQRKDLDRFVVAKIGDPDETVAPGEHVYRIGYRIEGVLEPGADTGTETQLYWNLVPGGWQQPIEQADLRVSLPAPAAGVRCAVGTAETDGCTVSGDGTATLRVRASDLAPGTPVTVQVGLDLPTPERTGVPWHPRYDWVLGESPAVLAAVLGLAVLAGVGGGLLGRRSREPEPGFPLGYLPPDDLGPAQAVYVLEEAVDDSTFVSTLLYAAERGAVDLDRDGDAWTLTQLRGGDGWGGVDTVTRVVSTLLDGPGGTFVADPDDAESGRRLQKAREALAERVESWARGSGLVARSGLGVAGRTAVGLAFAAFLLLLIANPFQMTATALVPGAFAVCGAALLGTGATTVRTRSGRQLWSRVGGFRRVLATPSSRARFDFSGREELYTRFIPWAVAFGCAEEWAEKYRTETAAEPPAPSYLPAHAGVTHGSAATSMVDDFGSTLDRAVSAYEATQSSSSSSGSGFSGGGGGGGGGGGSW